MDKKPVSNLQPQLYAPSTFYQENLSQRVVSNNFLVHIGLIFILVTLMIIGSILFIFKPKRATLWFISICFFLLLYFIRNIEQYASTLFFWSQINEAVIYLENVLRDGIAASFMLFTVSYFDFGQYQKQLWRMTRVTLFIMLICSVWRAFALSTWHLSSPTTQALFFVDIGVVVFTSIFILVSLWKINPPHGRLFSIGTLSFIAICYLGIYLNTTWLGDIDTFYSSEMYATYATILYLLYILGVIVHRTYRDQSRVEKFELESSYLDQVNRERSRLYANISHEFRTPLTFIQGALEKIQGHDQAIDSIEQQSNHQLELVDEMMDLAKAEATSAPSHMVDDDLIGYIRYIQKSFTK